MSTARPRSAWNAAKEARRAKRWDDPQVQARREAALARRTRELERREHEARRQFREELARGHAEQVKAHLAPLLAATRRG